MRLWKIPEMTIEHVKSRHKLPKALALLYSIQHPANTKFRNSITDDSNGSIRSYLKKVFLPNLCVRPWFQVLDILEYACGLKLDPASTLSQNPIFEMASSEDVEYYKDRRIETLVFRQTEKGR